MVRRLRPRNPREQTAVTQRDPFEEYRKRREIELMEHDFQASAGEKRERLESLLSGLFERTSSRAVDSRYLRPRR